ncbi:MAG: MarR family transcriptional regulator [Pseudomonadota bacterium]
MPSGTDAPPDLTAIFDAVEFRDAYRISYITNAVIVPGYDTIKRDFGIIRAEYLLLLCLAHYPLLSARDVAKMTRRPRNSISRAVHRMLAVGYIERAPDPDDGRQAKLSITASGRALHERIATVLVARQQQVFEPLTRAERATLDTLLNKLARHASTLKA